MLVTVTDTTGALLSFDSTGEDTIASLKKRIHDSEGVPAQYQILAYSNEQLDDSAHLHDIGDGEALDLELHYALAGGGPGVHTGGFECKFRCMCCYSGIDGEWERCQFLCVKCECNIL